MCRKKPMDRKLAPDSREAPQALGRAERRAVNQSIGLMRATEKRRRHLIQLGLLSDHDIERGMMGELDLEKALRRAADRLGHLGIPTY